MPNSDVLKTFKTGDLIMKQGELGDCAYIIEKGRVEIIVEKSDGSTQSVGTRGPGSMIGEMALIDKAPRSATVRAIEDCEFLVISDQDFQGRIEHADPILKMIIHVILTRYRDTLSRAYITSSTTAAEMTEINYSGVSSAVERIKLANDLEAALKNNELQLHYQPIIDLSTKQPAGFEALARWTHP